MGVFTETIPSFPVARIRASKLQTLANLASAITTDWTPWVPILANQSKGDGTVRADYRQLGDWIDFEYVFTLGGTSTVGTGPTFTLPVAPSSSYTTFEIVGTGEAQFYQAAALFGGAGSSVCQIGYYTSGTFTGITAAAPVAWGTANHMTISGGYRTA